MTLGIMLNDLFVAETAKISVRNSNEERLFMALNQAFENLAAYKMHKCHVIHGAKSFVSFDEIQGHQAFYAKDRGVNVKCELADLLIISADLREMRVCCLQNKYEKNKVGLDVADSFKADMRQFYLLKRRPVFEKSGVTNPLLYDAICPSVGAYGVFYRDGGQYDMNYYSASVLECLRDDLYGRSRHIKVNYDEPKSVLRKASMGSIFSELQYSKGIIDFGNALESMKIGTPINISEGLTSLGDVDIINAVADVLNNDIADLNGIRETVMYSPKAISYRTAIVIKGSDNSEEGNMNSREIDRL